MPREARFRIGVDENGLGPRLGPLIVTGVLARVEGDGSAVAARPPRGSLAKRLGDSKQLVSHGDIALAEAWARALVARGCGRPHAERDRGESLADRCTARASHRGLVEALSLEAPEELRAPCPSHVAPQCWAAWESTFSADGRLVQTMLRDLDRLAARGLAVIAVRSVIVCTRRLNDALATGTNRFVSDLHAMERVVLALRDMAGDEVNAVCGKVGGFGRYAGAFGPLGGRLYMTLEESPAKSAYRFPGVGELAFVRDGDASDLLVAMASMVGKYLREALMGNIVRHYKKTVPDLDHASGYSDPLTSAFIRATALVRKRARVPDACFERRAMSDETT